MRRPRRRPPHCPGAVLLRGLARERAPELVAGIGLIAAVSPFRRMVTPGGWEMSVALTNCGQVGWITDRTGYRYDEIDPETGRSWPAMPQAFSNLAVEAAETAGFWGFCPDACLVNRYAPGARLSLHQGRNVSVISISRSYRLSFGGARKLLLQ